MTIKNPFQFLLMEKILRSDYQFGEIAKEQKKKVIKSLVNAWHNEDANGLNTWVYFVKLIKSV